jgi:radical SAM protein with 4Fe4S-binding SPASM domain
MIINLEDYFSKHNNWLYNELKNLKQDVLPDDFRLIVNYTSDQYNNVDSPGIAISKLQELLALLDFPNFFVTIETTNKNIQKDLEKIKELYCPFESILSYNIVGGEFKKIILSNDTLCVLPWIHLYINPQGTVGTCCEFNEHYPLGFIKNNPLQEIANSDAMKTVRRQMLSGQRPISCSSCWTKEDAGLPSNRQLANQQFSQHLSLSEQTHEDGHVKDFKLRYLDFRASNVCNLKCRMCGGKFSSRIAKEENDLYNTSTYIDLKLTSAEIYSTLNYIEENIDYLESVYFAGGEPLIMEEHYKILDLLLKHNKSDIKINYNTNLTQLSYKKYNIVDYWEKFSNIIVGASIDLIGPQAGYVRSGTDYDELEENYESIKDHVGFNITSIVHLCNIFNLPKLQRHWITNKKLNPKNLSFRALIYPENMTLQVLPPPYKKLARDSINQHIVWLESISGATSLAETWKNMLHYMDIKDQSHLLKDFFRLNDAKDEIRNERFEDVFPEYKELRNFI